jgi:hypothetical protein
MRLRERALMIYRANMPMRGYAGTPYTEADEAMMEAVEEELKAIRHDIGVIKSKVFALEQRGRDE